jgi:NADPH:quinone reductase-like Zn-dependent oxidoreductase
MLVRLARPVVLSRFSSQTMRRYLSNPNQADLIALKDLVEADRIKPVIDRTYALDDAVAALQHIAGGHARGKVVLAT